MQLDCPTIPHAHLIWSEDSILLQGLPPLTGPNQEYMNRIKMLHDALTHEDTVFLRGKILRGA